MRCYLAILLSSFALNSTAQNNAWPGFPPPQYKEDIRGKFHPQHIGGTIRAILQARNGDYWMGSDTEGVYHYDGSALHHYSAGNGLPGNQVRSIQEGSNHSIWLETDKGICLYADSLFTPYDVIAKKLKDAFPPGSTILSVRPEPGCDLWFPAADGLYHYDCRFMKHLLLAQNTLQYSEEYATHISGGPFAVYCVYKDKAGIVWIGTQSKGVGRYDGKKISWLTSYGLAGSAVRAIFQDSKGNMWFGNNGAGLFRYDGHVLTNVTEEHNLGNPQFLTSKTVVDKPGTLARVWAINEDNKGYLWIATIDAGAWEYDGRKFTNYTAKDGLNGDIVHTIYKDHDGILWFGTNKGVCRYKNGKFSGAPF